MGLKAVAEKLSATVVSFEGGHLGEDVSVIDDVRRHLSALGDEMVA